MLISSFDWSSAGADLIGFGLVFLIYKLWAFLFCQAGTHLAFGVIVCSLCS